MAGQVKVAVVSGPISSGGAGAADFTKAGFGTAKACIVLLSFDTTDDTSIAAEGKASIGFSDFTNHRVITHQDEDGSAKVDSDAGKHNNRAYVLMDVDGVVAIDGTASTIADGVRLTNTINTPAVAIFATVIMFGGADLQVSLDTVPVQNDVGLTSVVTTGIPQDLVFFIAADLTGENTKVTGVNNSFGVVDISNDQATIVNRTMGWASDHNNNVGSPSSIIRTDRCIKILTETAGDDWGLELTAATPTSYTVTTRDVAAGNGMEVYALALNLDNRASKVGSVDSPTAGPTWTPAVALGFTPQYVGLGVTHAQVENTIEADADAGGLGISSNTGPGEETFHGWYNEDASVAANTNNNFRSRVIDFRNDDVTVIVHDHSHLSFNVGDWTYTINTENETVARKWFYWAIEAEEAAGELFFQNTDGALNFAGDITRKTGIFPSGALSFVGTVTKKTFLAGLAGAVSFAGALVKKTKIRLDGVLSFTGALTAIRLFFLSIGGALSFSGLLVRKTQKPLAGVLSFVGVVTRKTSKQVAGVLNFAGALSRKTSKILAGVLSFVGVLDVRIVIKKSVDGVLSFSGALVKKTKKQVSGVLSFVGIITRKTSKQVVGTLSFAGVLSKKTSKALVGALSFVGALATVIVVKKSVAGILSFLGVLTTVFTPGGAVAVRSWVSSLIRDSIRRGE